jgi:hypothetical protein
MDYTVFLWQCSYNCVMKIQIHIEHVTKKHEIGSNPAMEIKDLK